MTAFIEPMGRSRRNSRDIGISDARDRLCALDELLNGSFAGRLPSSARAGKDDYLLQTIHNVKV